MDTVHTWETKRFVGIAAGLLQGCRKEAKKKGDRKLELLHPSFTMQVKGVGCGNGEPVR